MDTRTKIVPLAEAARLAADGATVITGYFDPLLAWHAERLLQAKQGTRPLLVAIVDPPETPILPSRARAELVAGLAVVDYVVQSAHGIRAHARLEEEDARTLQELIEHVHARNPVRS